jgi:nicotinate-nucleotide pyrophosphorylase (carboxylating)
MNTPSNPYHQAHPFDLYHDLPTSHATLQLINLALEEDLGAGDITSIAIVPSEKQAQAIIRAKQDGILCGTCIFTQVYHMITKKIDFSWFAKDGDWVVAGQDVGTCLGPARALMEGERTALNFIQRMSGIATQTHALVQSLQGYSTQLLDTRKTLPGFRLLDKYAVHVGGGTNHRIGLFDMILLKENHIRVAGGIKSAVKLAKSRYPNVVIEVEATNEQEVLEACEAKVQIVMFDNMDDEQVRRCIYLVREFNRSLTQPIRVEVSGNVNPDRLRILADFGVDYISMGALTHSVHAFDLSLLIQL